MRTSGTLYIVATPIGNLEDITFRAVRILKEVDIIAAEDTRHTRKLLSHFGIGKPLTSYFDHNKHLKGEAILDRLRHGASVALVSDAGTPCIADPGYQLVRDAVADGISVVPIPGVSAAITALSAAGLPTDSFTFIGFLSSRQGKRREQLSALKAEGRVLIFYEAPNRLMATLGDMRDIWGERDMVVARELTKIFEEFARGAASEVIARFMDRQVKGEVVILVAPAEELERGNVGTESLQNALSRYLFVEGLTLKDAVKRVSVELDRPRSEVYAEALRIKS
ncbi:16S rRNA (cytidine(1402)-2'-O)-methyltransferase [Geobacter sp.]|uniref:16S rRNA (cytidine(1402)-2'-O)-methyltransferase n=1 Tax=Geobacter sp. TaxID=46610 RepID=UPI0027BA4867|nr:16S rRNA (cytidine(1402)-2'-O)-methyltransferase [Geobacter sp.]